MQPAVNEGPRCMHRSIHEDYSVTNGRWAARGTDAALMTTDGIQECTGLWWIVEVKSFRSTEEDLE